MYENHHEKALGVRRRVLGDEHPSTLNSMHNLCALQAETDGMEVDFQLLGEVLDGVGRLPEGTPIRVDVEAYWRNRPEAHPAGRG